VAPVSVMRFHPTMSTHPGNIGGGAFLVGVACRFVYPRLEP
jgi:hypothetical protein